MAQIDKFLKFLVKERGSDLHVVTDSAPLVRIDGDLQKMKLPAFTAEQVKALVYEIIPERNEVCRYKKIADLQKQRVKCYKLDDKKPDGKYRFIDTLVITKRAMREVLRKQLDAVFGK